MRRSRRNRQCERRVHIQHLKKVLSTAHHLRSSDMSNVIQYIKYALLTRDSYYCDRGVGCRKEEVAFQPQRFGSVGVDHAAVRESYHALADVPTGDFIEGFDDAPAEGFRGFAIGDGIPMAGYTRQAHDVALSFLQGLVEGLQVGFVLRQ